MSDRWKIFAVLAAMFTVGFFFRVSMAVVSKDLVADLGLTAAQLGLVSGIFFYGFAAMQLPLGPLIDRFGGRIMISLFGLATMCGSLLFSLAGGYASALIARLLLGCGTACVLMGALKILSGLFPAKRFAHITGYLIGIGNLGGVCATWPLARAVSCCGWRNVFLAMTVIQLVATVGVFWFVRDSKDIKDLEDAKDRQPSQDLASGDAGSQKAQGPVSRQEMLQAWSILVRSRDFWLVGFLAYFWYANYMVLLSLWGGPYLMEVLSLSRSWTGGLLLCISLGYICGSLAIGRAIDWHGGKLEKTIGRGQLVLLLLMLVTLGPAERIPVFMLAVVFFLIGAVSASGTIIYPLARNLVPDRYAATAMTGVNFFLLMGAATMQHIMGQVIYTFPRTSSGYPAAAYHTAFAIPIAGLLVILLLFRLFRVLKGGKSIEPAEDVIIGS